MTTNGTVRNTKYSLFLQVLPHEKNTEISVPNCSCARQSTSAAMDQASTLAAFAIDRLTRLRHGVTLAALRLTRRKP